MSNAEQVADSIEPPSWSASAGPRFLIGRGRRGGWIVNDRLGLVGGIFISESAARHFASEECDRHPELIAVMDNVPLELEFRKAG